MKKKLRTELLEAIPPAPTGPEVEAAKPPLSKPDGGIDSPFSMQPVVDRRGSATWTIPLQVSVTVGGFDGPEPVHNAAVTPSVVAPTITQALVATADAGENTELRAALEELASAGSRVYYDEAGDQAAVDAYYAAIRANASGKTLFESLSRLVQSTHATELTYRPAVHLYPWIDLHPDLKVRSIYSGRDFAAEALIREDFRIDEARAERLREMMVTESTNSTVRIREALDLLEASLPYNCEHVVPQSWFMKREPMRGDLHHLFACETGCNSFRGNTPYYDFPDFEEAVRDACGKRAEDKFEPQRGKGAVARAVLYFLLRYPKQVGDDGREMQDDRLPILLEWHRQNPPDAYEKHRNAAIFEKQGNRNPLIDRPEWADKIDFSLGFS